jgi:pimeloyl-ACP methyl ester carboxylesterase
MMLASLRQSAGLLRALGRDLPADVRPGRYVLPTYLENFTVDVYEPRTGEPAWALPTVVVNHGLSPTAADDPRFLKLCTAFSAQGFRVVAPHLPTLRRLEITPHTIEEMVAVYNGLAACDVVPMTTPVGVFGVSFSAGLGMIAANDPRVELPISALFCLGGYADLAATLEGLLQPVDPAQPRDDYGRLVFLHNWLHAIVDRPSPGLRAWLWQAILDNLSGDGRASAAMAASLPAAERELAARLADPGEPEIAEACRALVRADTRVIRKLSPLTEDHRLRLPTWLMHGRCDPVIPAAESRKIERRLRLSATPVRALYTDAVGHSGTEDTGRLGMMWEQLRVVAFTAEWIMHVRLAAGRPRRSGRPTAVPGGSPRPTGRVAARPAPWQRRAHGPSPVGL